MVEKKEGGKLATRRHLARSVSRLKKGGIASFLALQPGHFRVCSVWWRHTINQRLSRTSVPSVHGRRTRLPATTAPIAPPRGPDLDTPIGEHLAGAFGVPQRSDVAVSPAIVRHTQLRLHVRASQDAEPALEVR
jgi:hypothetical protein